MADLTLTAANVIATEATTASAIAGEAITVGQVVYISTSDGKAYKALAAGTALQARAAGIALGSAAAGQPVVYATRGKIASQTSTYAAKGHTIILAGTAGGLHAVDVDGPPASTEHLTLIGFASGTAELTLNIVPNIMTI